MTINKIISTIIAAMMVGATTLFLASQNVVSARNTSQNAIEIYTDVIADKGTISAVDYNEYTSKLSSTGVIYETTITVERPVPSPQSNNSDEDQLNKYYTTIFNWSNGVSENKTPNGPDGKDVVYLFEGDIVTVTSVPINQPLPNMLIKSFTGIRLKDDVVSVSRRVRNTGGI